jgi:L-histidine N-alpha-methyltransferase
VSEETYTKTIVEGLLSDPKYIPDSAYYDDDEGSIYFEKLLLDADYYPAHCENEIITENSHQLVSYLPENVTVIDIGAGEGSKTKPILAALYNVSKLKRYICIDISKRYLDNLTHSLKNLFPDIGILPLHLDFYEALQKIRAEENKLLLFLGNSFGNLSKEGQQDFLNFVSRNTKKGDFLLLGLDLKKDEKILHRAYRNTCKDWCFYLFDKINRELKANFDKKLFEYQTEYCKDTGEYRWFFISKSAHTVYLSEVNKEVVFSKGEKIFIGRSFKFDEEEVKDMVHNAGMEVEHTFYDSKKYFAEFLIKSL